MLYNKMKQITQWPQNLMPVTVGPIFKVLWNIPDDHHKLVKQDIWMVEQPLKLVHLANVKKIKNNIQCFVLLTTSLQDWSKLPLCYFTLINLMPDDF